MRRRALALFLLAPLMGEALSGSTPPLAFLNPIVFVFQAGLYGSGAVIARELIRGRGLGWRNLLVLGAAYGVWEESIIVTSWYNPVWPDLLPISQVGRVADINWVWALALTMFHMTISITVPVLLVETAFRDPGHQRWTRNRTLWLLGVLMLAVSAFGLYGFGFHNFAAKGYAHPPAAYFFGVAVFVVLLIAGLRWRPAPRSAEGSPPSLWLLRLAGLGAGVAWFVGLWILTRWFPHAGAIAFVWLAVLLGLSWRTVDRWSKRAGWGRPHELALASGVVGFMICITPLSELSGKFGSVVLGLAILVFLIWLALRRTTTRAAAPPPSPVAPVSV